MQSWFITKKDSRVIIKITMRDVAAVECSVVRAWADAVEVEECGTGKNHLINFAHIICAETV